MHGACLVALLMLYVSPSVCSEYCAGEFCTAETAGMSMLQTQTRNMMKVTVHDHSEHDDAHESGDEELQDADELAESEEGETAEMMQVAQEGPKYKSLGLGWCSTRDGKTAPKKWHGRTGTTFAAAEAKCKQLCDANAKCAGYSAARTKNCINWLAARGSLIRQKKSWGGSKCMVKPADDKPTHRRRRRSSLHKGRYKGKYADLGSGKCQMRGAKPSQRYYANTGAAKCKSRCSASTKCGGYTVGKFKDNCMLWYGSPLYGGGGWEVRVGGGHCIVKLVPGQEQTKSATTVVGEAPKDETDNWDDMSSYRRRRTSKPPPPSDEDY